MPRTPGRQRRAPSRSKAATGARHGGSEHTHEPGSKRSDFTYRGKAVEVHAGEKGCCVVIDGERVDYVVDEDGIYSHELAYQKFGSPEELAEEVIRQWGQAKIERTPVPHDHDHDHDDDHDH
jgi:hypothetical protein